jgi:hypothetical protein
MCEKKEGGANPVFPFLLTIDPPNKSPFKIRKNRFIEKNDFIHFIAPSKARITLSSNEEPATQLEKATNKVTTIIATAVFLPHIANLPAF